MCGQRGRLDNTALNFLAPSPSTVSRTVLYIKKHSDLVRFNIESLTMSTLSR